MSGKAISIYHGCIRQLLALRAIRVLAALFSDSFVGFTRMARQAALIICALLFNLALTGMAQTAPASDPGRVSLSIDVSKPGAKIDRNIFGQFAEHLGHGVYEGIWVGPDSN